MRALLFLAAFLGGCGLAIAGEAPFVRPTAIPYPADNPYSPEKLALGQKLFFDNRLSRSETIACASCHQPQHAFGDSVAGSVGEAGTPLPRNSPALWDLAWGKAFFWDGRAASLEEQAHGPFTSAKEMNMDAPSLEARLKTDGDLRLAFAEAFPEDPRPTTENALKAVATYVRSLVPAPNRVDRWAAGDHAALTDQERQGAAVFYGKGNCAACHAGPSFTDYSFHDIGLADAGDPGRGKILAMAALDHAFKTPSLRGIASSAPYMHDGSLPDLETVVRHYETGVTPRSTVSSEIRHVTFTDDERNALVAFLKAVGEGDGSIDPLPPLVEETPLPPAVATSEIAQKGKAFAPLHVSLKEGATLTVKNDDTVDHTVRIHDAGVDFSSGTMAPGQDARITFDKPGRYRAFCGIHPQMELVIDVEK
ncbi:MAG: cytochrome c peroxidase [Hyphomicrobiales bacterium]